ncbi:MAG: prepilin peptidase [Kiloniellales bacterium]
MILPGWLDSASLLLFAAALIWAAGSDLLRLRIPNPVVVAIAALYPLHAISAPEPVDWQGALVVAGLVLAVGFGLFEFRILGGGDAKLLAAAALWAGPSQIVTLLLSTGIIGGLLAILATTPLRLLLPYVAAATRVDADAGRLMKMQIPYGVAIAAGGLIVAARLAGV